MQSKEKEKIRKANSYKEKCKLFGVPKNTWRMNNRAYANLTVVLKEHNLTLDQYHALQERQDFHCAICDEENDLHVDHDHKTSKVRGLLCFKHNTALGSFNDNIVALRKAAEYVEKHQCQ